MLSAGQLIWTSCRPLFRLIICVGCGFGITKADLFPAVAAQGTSQILLNIAYPSLMFSKIVPAFSIQNISALGPIVLVALIYQILGIVIAWVVSRLFWVPHRFRWGILVAGGWGNVGDIPTAVVLSIMAEAPFNGSVDQTLGVGYIAGFIFVSVITFFPLGGNRLVALDYVGPDVEQDEVKEALRQRRRRIFVDWPQRAIHFLTCSKAIPQDAAINEKSPTAEQPTVEKESQSRPGPKHVSFYEGESHTLSNRIFGPSRRVNSHLDSAAPTATAVDTEDPAPNILPTSTADTQAAPGRRRLRANLTTFLRNLFIPASAAILASFIIALVPQLKALFVDVAGTHIPNAPDGQPPLAFVMDAATFIGAASVPMALVCLGSALARLRVPRGSWGSLPIGAILSLSAGKMLLFPVLGVLICKGLVQGGVISRDDKVLQFICMFFSCLPTATTQVFVTQVASGTGSAEHLSAFLIPQYALMLISMTALTAYALEDLF
ncbi:auxin efflux carrier transmembrane protein [Mycena maculata]|uniref:Auxin efflux carrier transmembrane protein n=1 Tax=Mycena maculata TaxID=230809 RepID=A0AAD7HEN7_9AGAR|nr:auxin efflux carrier transmembrane protein [Mycena maculata]